MSTISECSKILRGTKRVCQTCAVRFYDLVRDPIVCPSCGAHYKAAPQPATQAAAGVASFTGKTGWRSRAFKRQEPALPAADLEQHILPSDARAVEDTADEIVSAGPEEDVVLEQEQDDAEISQLTDRDVAETRE